jgi:hypothetical protein
MKGLPIHISDEDLETVFNMAACNYAPSDIALQLGVDKKSFLALFNNKESDVRQSYDAGKLSTNFAIMGKQKELAEGGNITAAQIFLKESERIEFENLKKLVYFGED